MPQWLVILNSEERVYMTQNVASMSRLSTEDRHYVELEESVYSEHLENVGNTTQPLLYRQIRHNATYVCQHVR